IITNVDFESAKTLLLIEKFISKLIAVGGTERLWAEELNKRLQIARFPDQYTKPIQPKGKVRFILISFPKDAPKPLLPLNLMPRMIRFLDLNPKEVARQMTLKDFEEFR